MAQLSTTTAQCPNPVTPESPVILDAAEPLVVRSAFLGWDPVAAGPGGNAQVSLPTHKMIKVFYARCRISSVAANQAAARDVALTALRFTGPFWTRVLRELEDSGLLDSSFSSALELAASISRLSITSVLT